MVFRIIVPPAALPGLWYTGSASFDPEYGRFADGEAAETIWYVTWSAIHTRDRFFMARDNRS